LAGGVGTHNRAEGERVAPGKRKFFGLI
jgi:hypothetical protein